MLAFLFLLKDISVFVKLIISYIHLEERHMKNVRCVFICVLMFFLFFSVSSYGADKRVVSEATVVSGGDLLISSTILKYSKTKNGYDFNYIFKHVDDYVRAADYAVINLETSIAGSGTEYSGFPRFNTPASIVTAAKNAGFDMFLTASNHSYDLGYKAVRHRVDVLNQNNVNYIGTRKYSSGNLHRVVNVNGIKIGMLNYARESGYSTKNRVILNRTRTGPGGSYEYVVVDKKGQKLISTYNERYLNEFYSKLRKDINKLKKKGAQVIVVYPHWGAEYIIGVDKMEDKIAQKMCDLGVDVIIGGHPHVVEPVRVYTSKKSGKTTVCLHSTGNFVSDMGPHQTHKKNAAYTKDGVLFSFTAKKYSDGTAAVTNVSALPLYTNQAPGHKYTVVPLDKNKNWNQFGIAKYSAKKEGYKSYHRTKNLITKGISKFNKMPKIYKQPGNIKVKSGKKISYRVAVAGANLKYQWQYSSDGGRTWKNSKAKGNKTDKIILKANKYSNGAVFRCRVKNGTGTVFSRKAKLTVK